MDRLTPFENKISIIFKDKKLLNTVFVHRSYLNEHPGFSKEHNERLEFLGDAVLELIVTEYLYKHYSNPEGELTNWRSALVRGAMLSNIAEKIDLNSYLYLSRGEEKSIGKARQIILANAFEALIGAIYLEKGYDVVKKFIEKYVLCYLPEILEKKLFIDAKSQFQELMQEKIATTPIYKLIEESGPDHNKKFKIGVYIKNELVGIGDGSSKQEAEQHAASNALKKNKSSSNEV